MNVDGKISHSRRYDMFRVLIVEDEFLYASAIMNELETNDIQCDIAVNASEAMDMVGSKKYHAILLDHKLPDAEGISLITSILGRQPEAVIVVMTAFETIQNAVQSIRLGAEDYLVKRTSVLPIVKKVLEIRNRYKIREKVKGWGDRGSDVLLGNSIAIRDVMEKVRKAALSPTTTVLITGESGVGKEVVAKHLHRLTCGDHGTFVTVDCVAIPSTLVESILFGYEKGAFTGADSTKNGAFGEAGNGTVFLDEIGEMDITLQGKLLRVLESRTYQRVGSVHPVEVKARVIASTNRDLSELVKQGRFRFDLYQRLSAFPINIPPLRERREDIPVLSQHFMDYFCSKLKNENKLLEKNVLDILISYDYPGNVRELRNIIEQAVILAEGESVTIKHLPERLFQERFNPFSDDLFKVQINPDFFPGIDTLETFEKKMILKALEQASGSRTEAARLLGISRHKLLRRMQKYKIISPVNKKRKR